MTLLNHIKKYSDETNRLHRDESLSGAQTRILGIKLLQELKGNVERVW